MAEWFKAAVLKTVERKLRGFKSYSLRQVYLGICGEMAESAEGARLLSECGGKLPPRVRIPLSPPFFLAPAFDMPMFFVRNSVEIQHYHTWVGSAFTVPG